MKQTSRIRHFGHTLSVFAFLGLMLLYAPLTKAAEVNFAGKTVTFWTPLAGAGPQIALQIWARHIAEFLPGKPDTVVRERFGGGGMTAANYFYSAAKPDGTAALLLNLPPIMAYASKGRGVNFDPNKMTAFGAESQNYLSIASAAAKIDSIETYKASRQDHTFGTRSRNFNVMMAELVWEALGNPIRVVTGFGSTDAMMHALSSGELKVGYIIDSAWTQGAASFRDLGLKPLYQVGTFNDAGELVRSKEFPELPTALEIFEKANPKGIGGDEHAALTTAAQLYQVSKTYWLPPGTPANISEAYRKAAIQAAASPKFNAEYEKTLGTPFLFVSPALTEKLLKDGQGQLARPYFQTGGRGYELIGGN